MFPLTRPTWSTIALVLALLLVAATTLVTNNSVAASGAATQFRYSVAFRGTFAFTPLHNCTDTECSGGHIVVGENMQRSHDTQPLNGMYACISITTSRPFEYSVTSGCSPIDTKMHIRVGGARLEATTFVVTGWTCQWETEYSCSEEAPRAITASGQWSAVGPLGHMSTSYTHIENRCKYSTGENHQGRSATTVISVDGTTYNGTNGSVGKGFAQSVHQCQ